MAVDSSPLRLIGLCAAWCGVCREFQPAFAQVLSRSSRLPHPLHAQWVDIEEPAISDALGDVDIQTFPTVAIGVADTVLFWGEIVPSEAVLWQLLERLNNPTGATQVDPDQQRAWRALCAHLWPSA